MTVINDRLLMKWLLITKVINEINDGYLLLVTALQGLDDYRLVLIPNLSQNT